MAFFVKNVPTNSRSDFYTAYYEVSDKLFEFLWQNIPEPGKVCDASHSQIKVVNYPPFLDGLHDLELKIFLGTQKDAMTLRVTSNSLPVITDDPERLRALSTSLLALAADLVRIEDFITKNLGFSKQSS